MNLIETIVLSIVEGLTEFLPVSSTGHMIIVSSLFHIADDPFTKVFTVAVQLGAILSVVVLYYKRFFQTFQFYVRLFIAFVPIAIAGLLLKKYVEHMLGDVLVVGLALFLGGIVLVFIDKWIKEPSREDTNEVTLPKALKIGLFQILALIPGVSRSAATIIGGLTQGLSRRAAAEFAFLLAVPTMLAATGKELYDTYKQNPHIFTHENLEFLAIGNFIAFVVALIAIRGFVSYLSKHGFKYFGFYRILIGMLIIVLCLSHVPLHSI